MPLSGDAQPYPKDAATQPGRPRRYRRRVAGPKQWAAIVSEKGTVCRLLSVECDLACTDYHHLVRRGGPMFGDDTADNVVPLCRHHHNRVTLGTLGALQDLAENLTDAEYAYCVSKLGEGAMQRLFGVER
jgi:hypothetical protein